MKLLGNRIIIVPVVEETHSGSKIIRARMSREMPNRGVVKHISDEAAKISGCKPGDMVIFDKHKQQLEDDEKTTTLKGEKGEELILAKVT